MADKPLFSFGVVADVQHADVEDGLDFFCTTLRRYRGAATRLNEACKHFQEENVDFVVNLGDLIDGKSRTPSPETKDLTDEERASLIWENNLVPCFERNGFRFWNPKTSNQDRKFVHNVVGNHELYCFSRQNLSQKLFSNSNNNRHYYSFIPHPSFRIIILDSYDFSTLNGGSEETSAAFNFIENKNPNDIRANVDWFVGVEGAERRWVPFNGSIGDEQLVWLEEELQIAKKQDQKVIILSHCHLCEGVARPGSLAWNYDRVLSSLHHENCVVAVLNGHDHRHGYLQDNKKIHHWSVPSILESADGAHAVLDVYANRIEIQGSGEIDSFVWEL